MRILFGATELPPASGITTFVENVAEELRGMGHTVDVFDASKPTPANLDPSAYDIVHLHGIWRPRLLKLAKKVRCSRLVWSTHGMTAPWSMRHKWWKKCLVWWLWQKPLLRRAALIHSTVEKEAEWNRALGLGGKEIVVPLGTHLPEGEILTQRRRDAERTLLFVGRVYPVKALDRLIEAFARVENEVKVKGEGEQWNWRLRIVGPDQAGHMAELKALCERLGANNVEFAGPKFGAELDAEYANCDILALVSHTENFGATVVDAMAHGKPVITSTATPWKEVEGKAGWWVDNDVDSLTDCLRVALTTPSEVLRAMGAKGRKLVESKYTWRAVASRLSTAYVKLAQGGR